MQEYSPSLANRVLVLNQSYEPISVCSAKKAFLLIYLLKADLVAEREDRVLRSVNATYPYPSVIRLSTYIRVKFKNIELSRRNILRRDNNQCQYCGKISSPLTLDHIIPRSRGGMDTWDNLVTACVRCNNRKGNQTPEEAGMKLAKQPRKPHHVIFLKNFMGKVDEAWKPYLFLD
ncbi:MAG: HNH endonuclease [Candidatus Kapaibacteriota bacterium]|jgi:5-methylcytosine-specific restriction endonuclease McrA